MCIELAEGMLRSQPGNAGVVPMCSIGVSVCTDRSHSCELGRVCCLGRPPRCIAESILPQPPQISESSPIGCFSMHMAMPLLRYIEPLAFVMRVVTLSCRVVTLRHQRDTRDRYKGSASPRTARRHESAFSLCPSSIRRAKVCEPGGDQRCFFGSTRQSIVPAIKQCVLAPDA